MCFVTWLFAHISSVLRNRLKNSDDKFIHFTNNHCESADVVRQYLDLIVDGRVEVDGDCEDSTLPDPYGQLPVFCQLAVFLRTYGCEHALQALLFATLRQLERRQLVRKLEHINYGDPDKLQARLVFNAFMVAAISDDRSAVLQAFLASRETWGFTFGLCNEMTAPLSGRDIFHPGNWSFMYWKVIPVDYIRALELAYDSLDPENTFIAWLERAGPLDVHLERARRMDM